MKFDCNTSIWENITAECDLTVLHTVCIAEWEYEKNTNKIWEKH